MSVLLASITMSAAAMHAAALTCDDTQSIAHAAAIAWQASDNQDSSHVFTVTSAHSVEVRIENGRMSVKLDGKEVPPDRVRQDGGRIRIIDENGDEITSLSIMHGDHWMKGIPGADADLFVQPFQGQWEPIRRWQRAAPGPMDAVAPPKVMLGVHMDDPGPALEKHLKLEPGKATMIIAVGRGLAAERAGLAPYDIIVNIDGNGQADQNTIRGIIADREPGDSLHLTVIQAGERRELKVPLEAYDAAQLGSVEWVGDSPQSFSFQLGDNPDNWQDILIDPDSRIFQRLRVVPDDIEIDLGDLKDHAQKAMPHASGLEDRIDTLNDRIAQLEEMIRQFIEQKER